MLKTIRAEFSQLRYDLFWWIQLIILIILSFYFGENPNIKPQSIFYRSISSLGFFHLVCIALPILSASISMAERSASQMVLANRTRLQIVAAKYLRYLVVYCIASLVYPLVNCLYYCLPWFQAMNSGDILYVLRCFGLYLLIGMAFASVPFLFVIVWQNVYFPLLASAVYFMITVVFFMWFRSNLEAIAPVAEILTWLPTGNMQAVMSRDASSFDILKAVISSIAVIAIFFSASYLWFRKADLK